MIIAEIGKNFSTTQKISHRSERTFLDFDFLIFDYIHILAGIEQNSVHQPTVKKAFEKRKAALTEFLTHKKVPIVIFAPEPIEVTFRINGASTSLAGPGFFLPVEHFIVEQSQGERIEIIPNTPFTAFLRKYEDYFFYKSYFTNHEGQAIAQTPHTRRTLAFYTTKCVFLPKLKRALEKPIEEEFLSELVLLCKNLVAPKNNFTLPEWSKRYLLPQEDETNQEILQLQEEIESKKNNLEKKQTELQEILNRKLLFTGTGNDLEFEIQKLFSEIGFNIIASEIGRDDLIVEYSGKVAVLEIKGVSGSAAEKYAAQLEKWVMNYYADQGVQPKAILLVNTYKDFDLHSRTMESWPNQMLKLSTQREHCLLTTVQLLGIYTEIRRNPTRKEFLINSLFNTIGIYKGFEDWTTFIEVI